MFTDGVTAIIVVVPLILPLAYAYKVDPYHLAAIFLLNLEIGFLIPPVGMNLFISSIRFGKPIAYVCRSVVPFVAILLVVLSIVTYAPKISTFLPGLIEAEEMGVSLGGGYMRFDRDPSELELVAGPDASVAAPPRDDGGMLDGGPFDGAVPDEAKLPPGAADAATPGPVPGSL